MATNRGQKIFIWVIAITMLVGTLGTYFLMILATDNNQKEMQQQAAELKKLQEQQKPKALQGYEATKFDADKVTKLETKDIKKGNKGKAATKDATLKVNYFGWMSDGSIFDSTNRGGEVTPAEFELSGVIDGWTEGLDGVKAGTVRELTIPADKAYGEEGSSSIPANSPLKFIVEVIEVK